MDGRAPTKKNKTEGVRMRLQGGRMSWICAYAHMHTHTHTHNEIHIMFNEQRDMCDSPWLPGNDCYPQGTHIQCTHTHTHTHTHAYSTPILPLNSLLVRLLDDHYTHNTRYTAHSTHTHTQHTHNTQATCVHLRAVIAT